MLEPGGSLAWYVRFCSEDAEQLRGTSVSHPESGSTEILWRLEIRTPQWMLWWVLFHMPPLEACPAMVKREMLLL